MKSLRGVCIGLAVVGIVAFLSNISFAEEGHHKWTENMESAKIKLIKDSAAALQQLNSNLAKSLNDWAMDEEKEMQERKEHEAKHEVKTKLLIDSAAALEKTNPDLAKGLREMAEEKHKGGKNRKK